MDHSIRPRPAAKPRARVAVHVIPEMTNPLGKHFRQPRREAILIGQDSAFMSRATFAALSEYSTTTPSGVYPGKMWKAELFKYVDGVHEGRPVRRMVSSGVWELRWFGIVPGNDKVCSNNRRTIVLPRAVGMSPSLAAPYGKREMSDREWAAQPAGLREGCTVHVPGVGDL